MRFKNAVTVVTGGSSGIGQAIARALLQEGAYVVIADIAEPATAAFKGFESMLAYSHHDIASESSWEALFARLKEEQRPLDVLVNCAGVVPTADVEGTDAALFARTMAINAGGTFLGCKYAMRVLQESGRAGAIVNVASTSPTNPAPWVTAYPASKAAVVNLTRSVALQGAQAQPQVRCNAVLPGVVLTPVVQAMLDAAPDPAAALAALTAQHPIGRLVSADEVAAAVLFLASSQASGITGAGLVVDGGMTAG